MVLLNPVTDQAQSSLSSYLSKNRLVPTKESGMLFSGSPANFMC